MKFKHESGALIECSGCSPELMLEISSRLGKLGFSEMSEEIEAEVLEEPEVKGLKKSLKKKSE